VIKPAEIAPPPPDLAQPCLPGPAYPDRPATIGEVIDIAEKHEAAFAKCAAKVDELVKAWPR
jgi:hypothetical protein